MAHHVVGEGLAIAKCHTHGHGTAFVVGWDEAPVASTAIEGCRSIIRQTQHGGCLGQLYTAGHNFILRAMTLEYRLVSQL